jgi:hypothetical protein
VHALPKRVRKTASAYCRTENIFIEVIVISELKFSNVIDGRATVPAEIACNIVAIIMTISLTFVTVYVYMQPSCSS